MHSKTEIHTSMTALEWVLLITLSIVWGGSFFFNEVALRDIPTFTVVVARVGLAAVALLIVMRVMGRRIPTDPGVWGAFFCMGLLNNAIPFSLIVWGQIHLASGVASIFNATTPLFAVIIAHFLTADEKMTGGRLFGVGIGFVGVVVMIGGDALQGLSATLLAALAILVAAVSYSFAGIFGRRFRQMGVSSIATAAGQVTASSVILFPVMMIVDRPWTLAMPGAASLWALVGVALLSTALAYILYFRILATAGATNLMLVTFLIPVSAILLGVALLGEVLLAKHLVGMGLIGCGLAAIDGRLWRQLRRTRSGKQN